MNAEHYSSEEETILLGLARAALRDAAAGQTLELPDLETLPSALGEARACFVTLHTHDGELRGCTGTLVARRPLAHEVCYMTVQTALHDPRFMPVQSFEVPGLVVEISVLTPPELLEFASPDELPERLRPLVDGVILVIDGRRATFLPQVWERVPDPELFLDMLCHKMGLSSGAWRQPGTVIYTYQSVIIEEDVPPA